jgi:hypothetical protein
VVWSTTIGAESGGSGDVVEVEAAMVVEGGRVVTVAGGGLAVVGEVPDDVSDVGGAEMAPPAHAPRRVAAAAAAPARRHAPVTLTRKEYARQPERGWGP